MKHAYHSLLPVSMQMSLMHAAENGIKQVDETVNEFYQNAPQRFHDVKSVSTRKFYHEPRQSIPNAGFNIALPEGINRK